MPSPPRRSTRGAPAAPPSTTSSSLSSARQDRSARGGNQQKSVTPRSLSSEDISEPPRRSQRAQQVLKEDSPTRNEEAIEDADEEAVDEEEITRCICGQQDYPGPPLSEAFDHIPDAQAEDAGGLFILCDGCTVWQHGGCVGIVEESQSPEKYYCEQCRPKQHFISVDSRGQKYSLYLPLHPKATRKASVSKSEKDAKKERESAGSRLSVDPATGKRRGTMRSKEHDDEEEQLRLAIEWSKREAQGGNGRRGGKRGRDADSDESKPESKRQRRVSELPAVARTASLEEDTDDGEGGTTSRLKKAKAEANLSARQAEQDEKDKEKERTRAEAAGRRQERARSRRGDDAEATEDSTPKPTPSARTSPPPASSQPPSPPPADKVVVKKGPGKKPVKKLGNNQYTKAKFEQALAASSPHGRKKQLQMSGSGDEGSETVANGETNGNTSGGGGKTSPPVENGTTTVKGKFGRGKKAAVNGNGLKSGESVQMEKTLPNMNAAIANMDLYTLSKLPELQASSAQDASPSENGLLLLGGASIPSGIDVPDDQRPEEELTAAELGVRLHNKFMEWQRLYGLGSAPVVA